MSKSPSLRRIQADIRELSLDPSSSFHAAPLENDMFEWHFTIRGAAGTDFEGGIYHGRILLPPEYPFKPPHIMFLTPSGRFEVNTKVCLSFSAYHPELWQPAWGIRLILEALISFLPTPADGAIGALDWSSKERKRLAKASQNWTCPRCGPICTLIPEVKEQEGQEKKSTSFAKEIAELHRLQQQAEAMRNGDDKQETDKDDVGDKNNSDASNGTTNVLQMDSPEEEIVFGDDSESKDDDSNNEGGQLEPTDEVVNLEQSNECDMTTDTEIATRTTTPEAAQNGSEIEVEEEHIATTQAPTNMSWLYDPLLNILIVLLIAICYLLFQKFLELKQELEQLEAWEYSQQLEQQYLKETTTSTMPNDEAMTEL